MVKYSKMRERRIGSDGIFKIVSYVLLTFTLLIVVYPIIYIISASFSSPYAVMSGRVFLFPVEPTLNGYKAVFENKQIWIGYANSAFYTVFGTFINIIITILAAYPLSRNDFYGRNLIMAIFTFTMFFSGGLIPYYLLIKNLGILNTRWVMLIPGAMSVWNVIIARTFFQSNIPVELLDASRIDGCSNIKFITKVVVPLSNPIIAVLALWYGCRTLEFLF